MLQLGVSASSSASSHCKQHCVKNWSTQSASNSSLAAVVGANPNRQHGGPMQWSEMLVKATKAHSPNATAGVTAADHAAMLSTVTGQMQALPQQPAHTSRTPKMLTLGAYMS